MERIYRVDFKRSHVHYNTSYCMYVKAETAPKACEQILGMYCKWDKKHAPLEFYPFKRKARRADETGKKLYKLYRIWGSELI